MTPIIIIIVIITYLTYQKLRNLELTPPVKCGSVREFSRKKQQKKFKTRSLIHAIRRNKTNKVVVKYAQWILKMIQQLQHT